MKCKMKRHISVLLILLMVFSLMPAKAISASVLEGESYVAEVEKAAVDLEKESEAPSSENVESAEEEALTEAVEPETVEPEVPEPEAVVLDASEPKAVALEASEPRAVALNALESGASEPDTIEPAALEQEVYPADALEARSVSAYSRIEAPDSTISAKASHDVEAFDLAPYNISNAKFDGPTAMHLLISTLESKGLDPTSESVLSLSDGWVNSICGAPGSNYSGLYWMYTVNGADPGASMSQYELKEGDNVLFYCAHWEYGYLASFENEEAIAAVGEEMSLTLSGALFGGSLKPLAGAELLKSTNGGSSADRLTGIITDDNGQASISFDSPGAYIVSAVRSNDKGIDITRPYCLVTVTDGPNEGGTDEPASGEDKPGTIEPGEAQQHTARSILNDARQYYDVTLNKALPSWWDIAAVKGAWGSLEGYDLPDYSNAFTAGQPSDYAGRILGMLAADMDPRAENGQDLVADLIAMQYAQHSDGRFSNLTNQNVWAVIALNAVGADSEYDKDKAVRAILNAQTSDGGFGASLTSTSGNLDYTGMALIALAGSRELDGVNSAIAKAIVNLKDSQITTGQLTGGWSGGSFGGNSNTTAIAISGLMAVGEDVCGNKWMIDDSGPLQALALFQHEDGGFKYALDSANSNYAASYQSIIALGDVDRGNSIWLNLNNVNISLPDDSDKPGSGTGSTGGGSADPSESATITVKLTVKGDSNIGTLINARTIDLKEGASAFDALKQGLEERGIAFDYSGPGTSVYITSINGLSEFDNGPESGWLYKVNGSSPVVSCGEIIVKQGDDVLFYYSDSLTAEQNTDLGIANGVINEIAGAASGIADPVTSLEVVQGYIEKIASFYQSRTELSRWEALDLLLHGRLSEGKLQEIKQSVLKADGKFRLVTDTALSALILQLAGEDITDVEGVNLLERIYNHENMGKQGVNGYIFSLIVMSNAGYIPVYSENDVRSVVEAILSVQNADGGFSLTQGGAVNYDITCMALTALGAYRSTPAVMEAIDNGFSYMSAIQDSDGYFDYEGVKSSETLSQLIIALCANGMNPDSEVFVKDGKSLMELLLNFQNSDGGFSNILGGEVTDISTEQAFLAMQSYVNFFEGESFVFDIRENILRPSLEPFADERAVSDWALKPVAKAYEIGLAHMDDNGNINPQEHITRAEFVKALLEVMGKEPSDVPEGVFYDVTEDNPYFGWIQKAFELGIINGFGDGSFAPDTPISRQDMAVIAAHAYGLTGDYGLIDDLDDASDYARAPLAALAGAGLIADMNSNSACPLNNATREAAFTLLIDILEVYELKVR